MKKQILLIEDNLEICASIKQFFELRDYNVYTETDGKSGYEFALKKHELIDIIILDINLPHLNGLAICHKLRKAGIELPILILTQEQGTDTLINAFDIGANDFVKKPFEPAELEARIKSLLRSLPNKSNNTIKTKHIEINLSKRKVYRNMREIYLRRKEFDLLLYLIRNIGEVLPREKILAQVWAFDSDPLPNTVDVHISFLRKKLNKNDSHRLIETIHGVGYRLKE